jgi:hypothetical protein
MAISIKGIPVYRISHFPIFGQTDIDPYHSVGSSHIFLWFPIDMQWYVPYTQHLQFIIYNYICIFFFKLCVRIYMYIYICVYIYIILHDVIYLIPSPGAGTHPSKQNWHIRQDVFVYIICQEAAELPKIRCVISHGLMWIKDLKGEAWGYDSWLVVSNMNFIFHFIYGMSSEPHWLSLHHFSRWLKRTTNQIVIYSLFCWIWEDSYL